MIVSIGMQGGNLTLEQPGKIAFGLGSRWQLVQDLSARKPRRAFIVTAPAMRSDAEDLMDSIRDGVTVSIWDSVVGEPTVEMFELARGVCRDFRPDLCVGIGGGSVLDMAKLVAAFNDSDQRISHAFGVGKLSGRRTRLACLPTTSGTGSEVSPNAILLDEGSRLKRAVVSPHLIPDSAYVDPELTVSVPPDVTAYTGFDALTHCIEAYANLFAHPMIDLYALEGIRLAAANLGPAYRDGNNLEARQGMSLASLYGGLCLGPVNTGAVHALAYPLGGEFRVPHGLSNSVLLPHVLEFNIPAMPDRYAEIARSLGAEGGASSLEVAFRGLDIIRGLMQTCGMPRRLCEIGIPREAMPEMAASAMTVTRLLKNNPRAVTLSDARGIYEKAW